MEETENIVKLIREKLKMMKIMDIMWNNCMKIKKRMLFMKEIKVIEWMWWKRRKVEEEKNKRMWNKSIKKVEEIKKKYKGWL
jgi:hypothetical protein